MEYIKSPMNYIGNKYRIMSQLQKWFPKKINVMLDLFCGGADVSINSRANHIIANDINYYVIDIFQTFQALGKERTLNYIDDTIARWSLSKENKEAYLEFRAYYNQSDRNPLDLYVLMCFSFNYQFRFNSKHEYNNPFGANRSSFNMSMRENLEKIFEKINDIKFDAYSFEKVDVDILRKGDFLYADPPYLLTCGSYNDGKRGFKGWSENDDRALFEILDHLDRKGIKFALSNVSEHKGIKHDELLEWKKENGYHLHNINFNYNNCNYHTKNSQNVTKEILITNY